MKLFSNFTSIPFDIKQLISWETNYVDKTPFWHSGKSCYGNVVISHVKLKFRAKVKDLSPTISVSVSVSVSVSKLRTQEG